jgi:hypothetical protein
MTHYPYNLHGVSPSPDSMVYAPGTWEFTATRDGAVQTLRLTTARELIDAEAMQVAWTLDWTLPGGPSRIEIVNRPTAEEVQP